MLHMFVCLFLSFCFFFQISVFFFYFFFICFKFDYAFLLIFFLICIATKQFCTIQYQWHNTNNKSSMIIQQQYEFNLKQLLMLEAINRKVQNDEANKYTDNVEKIKIDAMNDNIKHTNKENKFMNVLKIIFYDGNCNNWYCFQSIKTLSIIFLNMIDLYLKQQYEWDPECGEMKRTHKTKCKKSARILNKNNSENVRNDRNDAIYLDQRLLLVNNINAVLNEFNTFLIKVKCGKCGDINVIKCTNTLKIDVNDGDQGVNATLNGTTTGSTYNIVVEFIFIKNINQLLVVIFLPKTIICCIQYLELIRMSKECEFENLNGCCDDILAGLAVADKIKEEK